MNFLARAGSLIWLSSKEHKDGSVTYFLQDSGSILASGQRKEVGMALKRFTPEQIIGMLREAGFKDTTGYEDKKCSKERSLLALGVRGFS